MRKKILTTFISTESIDFQDGTFFKKLTQCVENIRGDYKGSNSPKYNSSVFDEMFKIIKNNTGLNIGLEEGGPAIYLPRITNNHIFFSNDFREMAQEYSNWDSYGDIRPLLKTMEKDLLKGSVSLTNSMVTGVFTKMNLRMAMPPEMYNFNSDFTSGEVAAIMLHELGHAFTSMEFLCRTVTTNQILSGMVRALDDTVPSKNKEVIFTKASQMLKMNAAQKEALLKAQNKENVTCIVLDSVITNSISELGKSIYDVNSCEQLADQFATRHGAGRDLVTGIDKIMKSGSYAPVFIIFTLNLLYFIALGGIVFGTIVFSATSFLIVALIILTNSKESDIYDNTRSRYIRIKLQNIEALKDKNLSKDLKIELIETNNAIDNITKYYDDNLSFIDTMSYYLKPSYRNAHKFELLQKDLERIGSSDLFSAAAKLSTI